MATEENERKTKLPEALREYFSAIVSIISFWAIATYWNVVFGELSLVPRLGFGAALSWVAFLHAEVIGMIIMSMMRRRLQAEARAQGRAEMMAQARAEAMNEIIAEARARARAEARAEAMEEAKAEAVSEAREARQIIRDLERQLREARNGEGANGGA